MNIFALHPSPIVSANWLCNHHVVKMLSESAEMLLLAKLSKGEKLGVTAIPYRMRHAHHPCTLWAGRSVANYNWLWRHAMELCDIYWQRYGQWKGTPHDYAWEISSRLVDFDRSNMLRDRDTILEPDEFASCTGECISLDIHTDYRKYYLSKWETSKKPMVWPDEPPIWFKNQTPEFIGLDIPTGRQGKIRWHPNYHPVVLPEDGEGEENESNEN